MRRILILALALTACHSKRQEPDDTPPMPSPELVAKQALYARLSDAVRDGDGFIETQECDSIHWSALLSAVTHPFNVRAAMDDDRRVYRRPLASYPECYASGGSASTVSNDALLMVLAYAVATKDLDLARDIFSFGHDHSWRMGDGDPFRTIMRPTLYSLYARAVLALGGPDFPERQLPTFVAGGDTLATGFDAHLAVVSLLTLLKIEGNLPEAGVDVLRRQVERQPNNALFQAALGRFEASHRWVAQQLLMNEAWWPNDRLPTSADRCEQWLTQRDEDEKDWVPCPDEGRTHSGGDFLFAVAVLKGEF